MISKKIKFSSFVLIMRCKLIKFGNTKKYTQKTQTKQISPSETAKALTPRFGIYSPKLTKVKHLQKSYAISNHNSCPVLVELKFELLYLKLK